MENDNEWEAKFMLNGAEYSANFNKTGAWTEPWNTFIRSMTVPISGW